jgi:myxalamid-type polyketide synthase MxaB
VAPADWPRFLAQLPEEYASTFFARLETQTGELRRASAAHRQFREALRSATDAKRRELLFAHVFEQVKAVLNLPAGVHINPQEGFFDLGMDSLMATEIRNRLQSTLDMPLPATIVLENGNLAALAAYLGEAFASPPPAPSEAVAVDEDLGPLLSEIENLSDSEIDRELATWAGQQNGEFPQ